MKTIPLNIGPIHFIGIGGIGMSGIAEVLRNLGYTVQGSDVADSANVKRLRSLDITVSIGHKAENVASANVVASIPDTVTSEVAAAAILKGMTAHLLIKSVYAVQSGDNVLLHAGAGGVGLILTQWATSLGAQVITTASTEHKKELSRRADAAEVLDYPDDPQQFGATVRQLTGGEGVVAVYDGVGKSTFDASLASLAVRGTLALFGAASGPVPPMDPQRLHAAGTGYGLNFRLSPFRAG